MSKRRPSLFFADNKDILDHLAAHQVFKVPLLRRLAAQRGIVLSSRNSREALAEYMAMLPFDRDQLDELLDLTETAERQRPSTLTTFEFGAESAAIQLAAEGLKNSRAELGEDLQVTTARDGVVTVRLTYTELNNARNRLDQKIVRTVVVEFENEEGGLRIRSTPARKAESVVDEVVSALWKEREPEKPPPKPLKIDLSGIRNADERTQFFYRMFKGMPGFVERGVSDVRVSRLEDEESEIADPRGEADSAERDDTLGEEDGKELRFIREERAMKNALKAAVLEGQNLLETPVYRQLQQAGYFLTKAIWRSRDSKTSLEAEFEAWFQDAKNAADFRYRVRTVSERDDSGEQGPHVRPDATQEQVLTRIIEDAARTAYEATAAAVGVQAPEAPSP